MSLKLNDIVQLNQRVKTRVRDNPPLKAKLTLFNIFLLFVEQLNILIYNIFVSNPVLGPGLGPGQSPGIGPGLGPCLILIS